MPTVTPALPSYKQSSNDKLVPENNIVYSLHIIYDNKALFASKNITGFDPSADVCFFCNKLPIRSFITSLDDPNSPEDTLMSSEFEEKNTFSITYECNELSKLLRMEKKMNSRQSWSHEALGLMMHYCRSPLIKYFKHDSQTGNISLIVVEK